MKKNEKTVEYYFIMKEVESSMITAVGYDSAREALLVTFLTSEETYIFTDVPEEVYQQLSSADSVGKAFNTMIKGKYEYERPTKNNPYITQVF